MIYLGKGRIGITQKQWRGNESHLKIQFIHSYKSFETDIKTEIDD